LTELARLVLSVSGSASGRTLWASEAVSAVARYIDMRSVFAATSAADRPWWTIVGLPFSFLEIQVVPTEDPESLLKWRDQFLMWRELAPRSPFGPDADRLVWNAAADDVYAHLDKGAPIPDPLRYDYLVGAAAQAPPANVLRRDLRQVTAAEWSRLCLAGFPVKSDTIRPFWAFIAGLRALGFHGGVLKSAMGLPHYLGADDRLELCERLVNSASKSSTAGYILVMRDDGISIAETVDYLRHSLAQKVAVPSLALPEEGLRSYKGALDWLAANGAVTRLIYEEGD